MTRLLLVTAASGRPDIASGLASTFPDLLVIPSTDRAGLEERLANSVIELIIVGEPLGWANSATIVQAIHSRIPGCPVLVVGDDPPSEATDALLDPTLDEYLSGPLTPTRLAAALRRAQQRAVAWQRMSVLEAGLEREQAARAQRRLQALVEADALLSETQDPSATLRQVANLVVPSVADWCAIDLLDATGQLQRLLVVHTDPARTTWAEELHRHYPANPDAPRGAWHVIRSREAELYPEVSDELLRASAQDERHLALLRAAGMRSAMVVPLAVRDQVLGALTLVASDSERHYGPDDLQWAAALARRAASAIAHARLFAELRAAEVESRAQAARATILAEASAAFARTSLEVDPLLDAVVRQVGERIGDSCSISLRSPDGAWLVPLATYHVDPQALELIRRLVAEHPVRVDASLSGRVVLSGKPLLVPHITPDQLRATVRPEYWPYLEQVGITSLLIAPLRAGGRTIGILALTRAQADQPYTLADQTFLQELADRAALAIANAQLHAAVTEQREWFRTTLASIGDAVIVTDTAGQVRFMNLVAENLTGWSSAEAFDQPLSAIFRVVNETTRAAVESPVDKVLREGMVVGLANHTVLLARDGREVPIDDSGAPIRDAQGALSGVVLVFRDITERRKAERELHQAHDQLAVILRGITDGITVQDRLGTLVYANDAAARLSGFATAAEMLTTPPRQILSRFEMLDGDGAPFPFDQLPGRLALRGEPGPDREIRFRALPSGVERYSLVHASPIYDEHGTVVLAVNIFRDITAQKREQRSQRFLSQASAALAASLDVQTTLHTVAALAVPALADWCVLDMLQPDGRIETMALAHVDPANVALGWELVRRYPLNPEAPYGTGHVIRTGQAELVPDVPDALLDAVAQDAEHPRMLRALGFCSSLCVPIWVGERVIGTVGLVGERPGRLGPEDVPVAEEFARRVGMALENARLYSAAQAAISARDQFLSIASHELKTPLTSLLGYIGVLQRRLGRSGALSERDMRALQVIEAQGVRLNTLIVSLLDLSRLQSGQLSIEPAPLDLRDLARRVVEEVEPTLTRHTLALSLPAGPVVIQGDVLRLEQVVQNLVQNAVKYSPDGGPISVEVGMAGTTATLAVRDAGIGIPADALPQLFQRFYRASNVDGAKISGMGVGLYVVREIMALHDGTVEVTSTEGQGSTFMLRFAHDPHARLPDTVPSLPSNAA
jgi:PAS domain S-box-containing protein